MNRNLDGTLLTTEQLWELAGLDEEQTKAVTALHTKNLIHSKLLDITRSKRFEMFMHGELKLDTSDIPWKGGG